MLNRRKLKGLGLDNDDIAAVVAELRNNSYDFEAGGYRFISEVTIDDTLTAELANDPYTLGCFAAWAIADATGWPLALIEAAQNGEQYEALGEGMSDEQVRELGQTLASHDGYGHHFARYDGTTHEITFSCSCCSSAYWRHFYAFKVD